MIIRIFVASNETNRPVFHSPIGTMESRTLEVSFNCSLFPKDFSCSFRKNKNGIQRIAFALILREVHFVKLNLSFLFLVGFGANGMTSFCTNSINDLHPSSLFSMTTLVIENQNLGSKAKVSSRPPPPPHHPPFPPLSITLGEKKKF